MKIRGNTIGTPIKPEKNIIKATDLTEAEKAQARENIGAISLDDLPIYDGSYTEIEGGGAIDLANIPKVDSIDDPTASSPTAVSYDDAIYLLVEGEINDGI